jgi:PAS domain S-box-containing protein
MWVFDRQSLVFLAVNESAVRIYGYSRDEFLRLTLRDMRPPDEIPRFLAYYQQSVLSRPPQGFWSVGMWKHRTRAGAVLTVDITSTLLSFEGRDAILAVINVVTARQRAEEARTETARRLEALSRRLLEVQEQERRALARELHDEIGQMLTALRLTLETGIRRAAEYQQSLTEAQVVVQVLLEQVRNLSLDLRPQMLDDLGLLPALQWLLRRYTAKTGVVVQFAHEGIERRFPAEVETAAYRIIQEALTNVARLSGVDIARVRLRGEDAHLALDIEDDGGGFDVVEVRSHGRGSGLSGMQERVTLLGGRLSVQAQPG